jgi:hypothetical protein
LQVCQQGPSGGGRRPHVVEQRPDPSFDLTYQPQDICLHGVDGADEFWYFRSIYQAINALDGLHDVCEELVEGEFLELFQDALGRCLRLLEGSGNRRHLEDIGIPPLQADGTVREKAELHDQLPGHQALGLQLSSQATLN